MNFKLKFTSGEHHLSFMSIRHEGRDLRTVYQIPPSRDGSSCHALNIYHSQALPLFLTAVVGGGNYHSRSTNEKPQVWGSNLLKAIQIRSEGTRIQAHIPVSSNSVLSYHLPLYFLFKD